MAELDPVQVAQNTFSNDVNVLTGIANTALGFMNYGLQKHYADKNFEQQQGWIEYQKALQKKIFEREDNAVQRRLADVTKAGFSPLAALGDSAGAGQVVSTSPAQHDVPQFSPIELGEVLRLNNELQSSQVQRDYIREQTKFLRTENDEKGWNLNYYKKLGMPTNGSMMERLINTGLSVFNTNLNKLPEQIRQYGEELKNWFNSQSLGDFEAYEKAIKKLYNSYDVDDLKNLKIEYSPGASKSAKEKTFAHVASDVIQTYGDPSNEEATYRWMYDNLPSDEARRKWTHPDELYPPK